MKEFALELFPGRKVYVELFDAVANAQQVLDACVPQSAGGEAPRKRQKTEGEEEVAEGSGATTTTTTTTTCAYPTVAVINAAMVVGAMQVQVAAHKAVFYAGAKKVGAEEQEGQEDDKTLQQHLASSIIFNLAASRSRSYAAEKFGAAVDTKFLLLASFVEEDLRSVAGMVQGAAAELSLLEARAADAETKAQLMKFYKIQEKELQASTLVEAVVARQAVRDC